MADEVPAERQIGRLVHLGERLLNLVLAEVDLARFGGGADVLCGKGFRNRDQAD